MFNLYVKELRQKLSDLTEDTGKKKFCSYIFISNSRNFILSTIFQFLKKVNHRYKTEKNYITKI